MYCPTTCIRLFLVHGCQSTLKHLLMSSLSVSSVPDRLLCSLLRVSCTIIRSLMSVLAHQQASEAMPRLAHEHSLAHPVAHMKLASVSPRLLNICMLGSYTQNFLCKLCPLTSRLMLAAVPVSSAGPNLAAPNHRTAVSHQREAAAEHDQPP